MFLQPDGTAIVQLINFVIFFAVLNVVFLRPVGRAIQKRREYINGLTADFDRYQAEATELREEAEELRANARRDAEALLTKQRGEASNESAAVSADYAQKVAQRVESAQQAVATELDTARTGEDRLARQLADLMVDRALAEAAK
jgi:F-type H+-transporting ATPase subunit b